MSQDQYIPSGTWGPDPAGSGQERYYDGHQWTDQYRPALNGAQPKKKRGCLTAALVVAALFTALLIAAIVAAPKDDTKTAASTTTAAPTSAPTTTTPATSAPGSTAPTTAAPATTAPPTTAPTQKGFRLDSLEVRQDFVNQFEGVARITDTEGGRSGGFTITLFDVKNQVVGTMTALRSDFPAGQPQTIGFISTSPYVAYDHYEFQVDFAV